MVITDPFGVEISEIEAGCKLISSGTSRRIYDFNGEWVVKVPYNKAGIEQNRFEAKTFEKFKNTGFAQLMSPLFFVEETGLVFMRKWEALPRIIRTTIEEFVETNFPGAVFPDWDLVKRFIKAAGLFDEDVYDCSAWAVSGQQVGLIDYGCSVDIYNRHYAGSW